MGTRIPLTLAPRPLAAALLPLLGFALSACEDVSVTEVGIDSVTVFPEESVLFVEETVQLSAVPMDAAGTPLGDRPFTWTSSAPEVATVDGEGLVVGVTAGTAEVRASTNGITGSTSITVLQPPAIQLSSTEVRFQAEAGSPSPQPVSIQVTNAGEGSLSGLTVETSYAPGGPAGWLEVQLNRTSAPASLAVRAFPEDLPAGTHSARIEVASGTASNSPGVIEVVLEVTEPGPAVSVQPGAVGFATAEGQPNPSPQTVSVRNDGEGELTGLSLEVVHAPGQADGWLDAVLDRTTAPAEVTVSVDPSGLVPGIYDATLEVRSSAAPGSTGQVSVRLAFGEAPPELELDPEAVEWQIVEGDPAPPVRTVEIRNRGSGSLGELEVDVREASGGPSGWLTASLDGTAAPAVLTLGISPGDLTPQTLEATVQVRSEDAINSPQEVGVLLTIEARPSPEHTVILADPGSIPADGVSTSTVTVQVNDIRGQPVDRGGHAVSLSSSRGTLSAVTDEGDGTYTATLTSSLLSFGTAVITGELEGEEIEDTAEVRFTLLPASPEASSIEASADSIPADGESTATLTVRLADSEGNPLPEGGNEVALSTSAGSLSDVSDEGDGTYTATLTAASTPGTAVVTGSVDGTEMDDRAEVTFTSAPPSPSESTIEADPAVIPADGSSTSAITVRLLDASGNPLQQGGNQVSLTTSAGSLSPVSDEGDGTYTATLTAASTPGTAVVTGTVDGADIQDSAEVEFEPVPDDPDEPSDPDDPQDPDDPDDPDDPSDPDDDPDDPDDPDDDPDDPGDPDDPDDADDPDGSPDPGNTTASVPDGTVGVPSGITITVRDGAGVGVVGAADALSAQVTGANGGTSFAPIQDDGEGIYTTRYVPANEGTDVIMIRLDGEHIDGSPFVRSVG